MANEFRNMMMSRLPAPRSRRDLAASLLALAASIAAATPARAQDEHPATTIVDQGLEDLLSRAARFEGQERWDEAAKVYLQAQDAIRERRRSSPERQYVARVSERLDWGLEEAIGARIAALPEAGRKAWLLTVDPRVQASLSGVKPLDIDALQAVIDRYPLAERTLEARARLADWALEQGQVRRAIAAWLALAQEAPARAPESLARALRCARILNDEAAAERITRLARELEVALDAEPRVDAPPASAEPPLPRLGRIEASGLLSQSELSKDIASRVATPLRYQLPVASPDGERFYIADSKTLRAYALVRNLELVWEHSLQGPDAEPERLDALRLAPALAPGRVIATFNRNRPAKRVARKAETEAPEAPQGGPKAPDKPNAPNKDDDESRDPDSAFEFEGRRNWRVIAFDADSGRPLWDLAEQDRFEAFSRDAEWLSPPAVAGDGVYVVATLLTNALRSYVIKASLEDGAILWISELASRSPENHRGLAGPVPAPVIEGGRVFVATSIGLAASLDAATGRLVWAYHYPVFPDRTQPTVVDQDRRFRVSAPQLIRAAGLVLFAPVDSPYLLALSRDHGERAWQRPREAGRYIAATGGSELILVGRQVERIDGRSGLTLAESPRLEGRPVAAPLVGPEALLIPTTAGFLRLKRGDLSIEARFAAREDEEVGELLPLPRDRLLSVGARRFQVYGSEARMRDELDTPGDFERYAAWGEHYERRGLAAKAVESYTRGLLTPEGKNDPDRRFRGTVGLARALRDLTREQRGVNAEEHRELARKLLSLLEKSEDLALRQGARDGAGYLLEAATIRCELGEALQSSDDPQDVALAVDAWQSVLTAVDEVTLDGAEAAPVRARLLATERLRELIARHGREVYAHYEALAAQAAALARERASRDRMEAVVERFPISEAAAEMRLAIAQHHIERYVFSEGEASLKSFLEAHPEHPRAAEALALLVKTYLARNRSHDAQLALDALRANFPSQRLALDGGSVSVEEFVAESQRSLAPITDPIARDQARRVGELAKDLSPSFRLETDLEGLRTYLIDPGPYLETPVFLLLRDNQLEARLADGGLLAWRLPGTPNPSPERPILGIGERLLIPLERELIAVDAATGLRLWSLPLTPPKGAAAAATGAITSLVTDDAMAYLLTSWGELWGIDPEAGAITWKHRNAATLSGHVTARDGAVVLGANAPARIFILDRKDGRIRKDIPLDPALDSALALAPRIVNGRALVAPSPTRLAAVNLETGALDFNITLLRLGAIASLHPSPDESKLLVLGRQQLTDTAALVALDSATGASLWSDDGRGAIGAIGRPPSKARIEQIICTQDFVYTLRQQSIQNHEVWAQDLDLGRRRWSWACPRGQGPERIVDTPGQLFVPYGGRLSSCSLTLIAKGSGKAIESVSLPGRRVVDAGVAGGQILVLTDRGQFAFTHLDARALSSEVIELLDERRASAARDSAEASSDPILGALLADRLAKLGRVAPAIELLARELQGPQLDQRSYELLMTKLVSLAEQRSESERPNLKIRRLTRPAEIDGELNDWWREWSAVELTGPVHVTPILGDGQGPGIWRGPEDLSARLYMAYDDRNFYFALDVRDLDLRPFDSESDNWIGDCLLIAIDCKNDGGLFYGRDDVLLSLALTRPRKKDKDEENPDGQPGEEERRKPQGKYFVKRKDDRSGAIYECKIPWAMFEEHGRSIDLTAGPPKGFKFGFNIVLTDDDGDRGDDGEGRGATKMLSWTPSVRLHRDKSRLWQGYMPEYFGTLELD